MHFDFDDNFDNHFNLDDLIELDIEYGLFEDDDKPIKQTKKKSKPKVKTIWDLFRS